MSYLLRIAVVCLLINAIRADETWGNIEAKKLGTHKVRVNINDTNLYTYTEFTYPKIPSEYPIVGLKYLDYHEPTKVEFVNGSIGDHQITIRLIAVLHEIVSDFVFYVDHDSHDSHRARGKLLGSIKDSIQ